MTDWQRPITLHCAHCWCLVCRVCPSSCVLRPPRLDPASSTSNTQLSQPQDAASHASPNASYARITPAKPSLPKPSHTPQTARCHPVRRCPPPFSDLPSRVKSPPTPSIPKIYPLLIPSPLAHCDHPGGPIDLTRPNSCSALYPSSQSRLPARAGGWRVEGGRAANDATSHRIDSRGASVSGRFAGSGRLQGVTVTRRRRRERKRCERKRCERMSRSANCSCTGTRRRHSDI